MNDMLNFFHLNVFVWSGVVFAKFSFEVLLFLLSFSFRIFQKIFFHASSMNVTLHCYYYFCLVVALRILNLYLECANWSNWMDEKENPDVEFLPKNILVDRKRCTEDTNKKITTHECKFVVTWTDFHLFFLTIQCYTYGIVYISLRSIWWCAF